MTTKLDINETPSISYCIPLQLRDEQVRINITKVSGRVTPAEEMQTEPIAIVCFGPSLKDTWKELKKFKYIMTCSGAHKFLIEKGIVPTHHVDLEPREHKIQMLGTPHGSVEYLIASTIHPRYLDQLEGFKVKLWHIFANDDEAQRILPRGEWSLTGGSSVGLRCMTLARFIGFTDLHIFGMDGSFAKGETHTDKHPNSPPQKFETEYEGKKYLTTPSILFCAKETWKELDQMKDVKATFYGEGLVQHMAKNYKPAYRNQTALAFNKPELISKEYIHLNNKLHRDNPSYGMGGAKHSDTVLKLSKELKTTSILDYGAGKGMLAKSLPFPIWQYDPAIPEIAASPQPADIVICSDVLEHIEQDKLQFVLDDLKRCTKQVGYFVISTRQAIKTYANGKNTHNIVQGKDWWNKKLSKYFDIGTIIDKEKECELHIVVAPKKVIQPDITVAEKNGTKVKFYTPNETTKWRAETLFTKEPSTVEWINQMKAGEILFDVGANVGSYSVLAGAKGVKVFSFEPEAENYAMLVKNLALNNIEPNAYCMAISDEEKAGTLYAGQQGVGGACHSFDEPVGHDLKVKQFSFSQGCFGIPLDTLIERGLPSPQHIKIDVDGLEYKVIRGAEKILRNGLKTLLVEVNAELNEHKDMVQYICSLGFGYDQAQVDKAKRKDGTFKGVAEYVFTKNVNSVGVHIAHRVHDAIVEFEPFNFIYIDKLFPEDVYKNMLSNMPDNYVEIEKSRGTKGYPQRFTSTPNSEPWVSLNKEMTSGYFKGALLRKFGIVDNDYTEDVLLVKDVAGYSIPPHTDSVKKVITVLIYLADENSNEEEGTSIFAPKKNGFTCKTGRHYKFDDFQKVDTMPFRPNSMFAFARTDDSFHGVEPCKGVRNVLLYNIKTKI